MNATDTAAPCLHLVFVVRGMLLVKRPGADWRALQDEFFDYKTSLGPYDLDEVLGLLQGEWPAAFARRQEIGEFVASPATVMSL
jgi:hypothetical protein